MAWYVEQRNARLRTGRQRRRNAWLVLLGLCSTYATWWSVRSFLG